MYRIVLLICLAVVLITGPGTHVGQAAIGPDSVHRQAPPMELGASPPFAPGQVVVRFKPDVTPGAALLVVPQGAELLHRIAAQTYIVAAPVGQEAQMVKALTSNPAVMYAALNYRITEPSADTLKPVTVEPAEEAGMILAQEPESCISDLWMSTTQQGERLVESMVPSGTPQAYVFFEYADCDLEAVRVQVFYLGRDTAPEVVFDEEGTIISGSGIQGVRVQAWPYFDKGNFPIGRYLTIISLSPEGGWDEVQNVAWRVSTFPDDHWFGGISNYQWPLHSTGRRALLEADINAPQAWDITTGSPDITIAIVSTGAVFSHPDLTNRIWTNQDEIPGNGVDDDENGCVDDVHGAEFYNSECFPDPTDSVGWGTYSAGIVAAETNNKIGMAGVTWGPRVMSIKVLRLQPDGGLGGFLADMILAIDYAVANGARIIHLGPRVADGGVSEEQLALLRGAIDDAVSQGALVIAGTGDLGQNQLSFPAGFDNVVAVGATGLQNERTWFANYGEGIDLVAPGELILSTCGSAQYCIGSGTSLAAAHVGGVASLIWSVDPDLSPADVRATLQDSASDIGPDGYDDEFGHGKLDAARAVELVPHHLWLRTPDLDRLALIFLLDDRVRYTCQTVWNRGTASQTWSLNSNSDWLTVEGPSEELSTIVPSGIQVCADAEKLPGSGSFQSTLQASSTLTRRTSPVEIDVTAIYRPSILRIRMGLVQRP
ncbi:MAG: S8 family serine peptidase [Anaerolineae bacterium]